MADILKTQNPAKSFASLQDRQEKFVDLPYMVWLTAAEAQFLLMKNSQWSRKIENGGNYAVWGLASKRYQDKFYDSKNEHFDLYVLQKETITLYLFLLMLMFLPVKLLYFESVCCLMYDVRNKIAPSKCNILNLFTDTSKIHTCNTRSSTSNTFLYKKKSRKSFFQNRRKGMKWAASFNKGTNQKTIQKEASHCSNGNFCNLAMTTQISRALQKATI